MMRMDFLIRIKVFPNRPIEEDENQPPQTNGAPPPPPPATESTPLHVPSLTKNNSRLHMDHEAAIHTIQTRPAAADKAVQVPTASMENLRDEVDGDDGAPEKPWERPDGGVLGN